MKSRLGVLVVGLAACLAFSVEHASAQPSYSPGVPVVSVAGFYGPLSQYGKWVNVPNYGSCWRPSAVAAGWRPYTEGTWVWTDSGWYWDSDEPWAWATYHYGYWTYTGPYGWVWIPGTDWAPAWVTWRQGPDYIGWAPCSVGGVVLDPSWFVFVDIHHFHDRIRPNVLAFDNHELFERSRGVDHFAHEQHRFNGVPRTVVVNRGPGVAPVQRATGARFPARPVGEVAARERVPNGVPSHSAQRGMEHEPAGTEAPHGTWGGPSGGEHGGDFGHGGGGYH